MHPCVDLRTMLAIFQMYFKVRERLSGPRGVVLEHEHARQHPLTFVEDKSKSRTFPGQSMHLIRRSYSPVLLLRVTTSKMSSGYLACIASVASVIHSGTVN